MVEGEGVTAAAAEQEDGCAMVEVREGRAVPLERDRRPSFWKDLFYCKKKEVSSPPANKHMPPFT